jgi:hypothetical protein
MREAAIHYFLLRMMKTENSQLSESASLSPKTIALRR